MTVIQKMYDRVSSGIPQTKQTDTKAETCMQDVCRFRLLGLAGMFDGVPVFLKEHMFYKAVMSRLEKTAVGVDRRSDIRGGEGKEVQKGKICKSCWNKNDGTERRDSMEATILETALSHGIWAARRTAVS